MRSVWGVFVGSVVFALLMQIMNCLFEAAGSVPDLEGCGFLAGGLGILAVAYPALSFLVAYKVTRRRLNLWEQAHTRDGGLTGAFGAALYLGLGISLAVVRGHGEAISWVSALWSLAFVILSYAGGSAGTLFSRVQATSFALRDSGS